MCHYVVMHFIILNVIIISVRNAVFARTSWESQSGHESAFVYTWNNFLVRLYCLSINVIKQAPHATNHLIRASMSAVFPLNAPILIFLCYFCFVCKIGVSRRLHFYRVVLSTHRFYFIKCWLRNDVNLLERSCGRWLIVLCQEKDIL